MRVLSFTELRERKGIVWSRPHVGRMVRAGKFPRPLKIGEATTAWVEQEIDDWLTERVVERDNTAA